MLITVTIDRISAVKRFKEQKIDSYTTNLFNFYILGSIPQNSLSLIQGKSLFVI